jgi:hypothetical protein
MRRREPIWSASTSEDEPRQIIESCRKYLDDAEKFEYLEIVGRWLPRYLGPRRMLVSLEPLDAVGIHHVSRHTSAIS